jgi:hypothetical protein
MRRGAPWTVERRRAVAWSLPWWVRWRWPCRHRRAVIGCGPASAAPQAETSYVPSGLSSWACGRGCPNACYAVRRPVRCPRVRVSQCPGVQWRVCRCPVCGCPFCRCPVCGRPVSASRVRASGIHVRPVRAGSVRGTSVRRGSASRLGRAGFGLVARRLCEWPGLSARAGRGGSWRRSCWAGESAAELAAVLGRAQAAAASRFDRLADQGQPVAGQGRPSGGWGHGRGAGCARGSPTWGMAVRRLSCVSSGAGSPA